jgi:hypothetical protein
MPFADNVAQAANGIRGEAFFPLLAVGHDGRACGFEARNGILNSGLVMRLQLRLRDASGLEGARCFDEDPRPGDTSDGFGWDCHA